MSDKNPVKEEVKTFDKKCLKKTNTAEKNTLPTKEGETLSGQSQRAPGPDASHTPGRPLTSSA
ncbi:TYBA protein, partial [Atractosteus spatula]|nr:TYBA protein [Atractosteus spatula]